MSVAIPRHDAAAPSAHRLRSTWPIHKRECGLLVLGYLVLVGVWISVGELLTGPLSNSAVTRNDQRIAEWMASHRTPTLNRFTLWGSDLAETLTKIAVTLVVAVVLLRVKKRWLEPLVLLVSLTIEAAAFIVVTTVVDRGRPSVQHLDASPVGSSFPSGHVAAAMAYIAMAVVVFWQTRRRLIRVLAVVVVTLVPIIVGLSRMYRGMHFFSDVIGGALLGGAAVALTVTVLCHSPEGAAAAADRSVESCERPGA